jgi:predicted component of type VI protein secretion system
MPHGTTSKKMTLAWQIDGKDYSYTVTSDRQVGLGRRMEEDIVLSDPSVSRQHAAIYAVEDKFYLRNLSQVNPVYIITNGEPEQLDFEQVAPLNIDTVFQVGPIQIKVTNIE